MQPTSSLSLLSLLLSSLTLSAWGRTIQENINRKYDSEVTNHCPQPSEDVPIPNPKYYTHPKDCRKFVTCDHGLPHVMNCPENTVFNDEVIACVHEDSPLSRAVQCPEKEKIETVCEDDTESLTPNPKACQRYYNCSDNSSRYYSFLEPFENECNYPDLFDHIDLRCKPWREARCAPGAEVGVGPCDYVKNQCVAAHCEPCFSRIPSCVGKPDGLNEHPTKLWTPYHVMCESNRSMEAKFCELDPARTPFRMLFSPVDRKCVTIWEVPREHNGFAPSCDKKDDDSFHVTAESDRVYYKCPGADVFFCGAGEMFSTEEQRCIQLMSTTQMTSQPSLMTSEGSQSTVAERKTTEGERETTPVPEEISTTTVEVGEETTTEKENEETTTEKEKVPAPPFYIPHVFGAGH